MKIFPNISKRISQTGAIHSLIRPCLAMLIAFAAVQAVDPLPVNALEPEATIVSEDAPEEVTADENTEENQDLPDTDDSDDENIVIDTEDEEEKNIVNADADSEDVIQITEEVAASPKVERSASGLYPAYVNADGDRVKVMVAGGTVEQLISKARVTLGDLDETSKPLDADIKPGDVIEVLRKEYVTVTKETAIPYKTNVTYSGDITPGSRVVEVAGEDGVQVQVVRQLLINGEVVEEAVKKNEVEKPAVDEVVVRGFPVPLVSPFDFSYEFDSNCEPIGYSSVLRSQKSAGYSAPDGAYTASGRKAIVGHVAVDPNIIPYGTRLFIKASDGSHIYGYAIAADTGTALMQGLITVDLFYGSYEESCENGIRNVDIFILD